MKMSDEEYKEIHQTTLGAIDGLEWSGRLFLDDEEIYNPISELYRIVTTCYECGMITREVFEMFEVDILKDKNVIYINHDVSTMIITAECYNGRLEYKIIFENDSEEDGMIFLDPFYVIRSAFDLINRKSMTLIKRLMECEKYVETNKENK